MTAGSNGAPAAAAGALVLERAVLDGEQLRFTTGGGLAAALRDGCFLLAIPAGLDLGPALTLSRQFYREPASDDADVAAYRGFRSRDGIYFDREHFQTEHVLIDGPGRRRHFPPDLIATCDAMNELALAILRVVLAHLGLAPELWDQATCGAVSNRGTHWFASSHYRPERRQLGCAPHKDTGFVTVLYIDQEGLEALVAERWRSIDPLPGHFVINFGGALEILTGGLATPVRAILHRVRRTEVAPGREDRFSFAAFANPPASGVLHRCSAGGTIEPHQSVEQFLSEFNRVTWHDRHDDFGIRAP